MFKKTSLCIVVFTILCYSSRVGSKTASPYEFTAVKNDNSFERGKNLVYNICGDCHYNEKTGKFTGKQMHDLPRILGVLYSSNLTDSKEYGVPPHYTDAEIYYLLRTGKKKNGGFAPYMLRPTLSDRDINDIIVYLRSGDEPVHDGDTRAGETHVNIIGRTGIRFFIKPGKYQTGVAGPDENNAVDYGGYLVANIGCYHCHSKNPKTLNYEHPEDTKGYMAGGSKFKNKKGETVFAPNLTPNTKTGIGNYSKEDFRMAVREGMTPGGEELDAPMPKFKHLTNKQVDAIYAYVMQLPAKHHVVRDH